MNEGMAKIVQETISKDKTFLIISTGQSLSVGASNSGALSLNALNPEKAFQMKDGDLTPLRESRFETPASGMIAQFFHQHEASGLPLPDVVHLHGGKSGQGLAPLSIRESDIFDSIDDGISGNQIGAAFAVKNEGSAEWILC